MRGRGALAQDGVGLFRDVLDLHARHGAIMAPEAPIRNHIGALGWAGPGVAKAHGKHPMTVTVRSPAAQGHPRAMRGWRDR